MAKSNVRSVEELLEEGVINNGQAETLNDCLRGRATLKEMKDDAEEGIENWNLIAKENLVSIGVKSVKNKQGTLTYQTTARSSLNRTSIVEGLLAEGMALDKINKIMDKATKTTESTSIVFRAAKD